MGRRIEQMHCRGFSLGIPISQLVPGPLQKKTAKPLKPNGMNCSLKKNVYYIYVISDFILQIILQTLFVTYSDVISS